MEIKLLTKDTVSKIAAGEVIERPASVVKELLENSIDAMAKNISITVADGGIGLIQVVDDGVGIPSQYLTLAFERHATSKITTVTDLESVDTLGFRGEALPRISSIATVDVKTKQKNVIAGRYIQLRHGTVMQQSDIGCPDGTNFIVKDLFSNVPARKKFLKSTATENSRITEVVSRIALLRPDISIRLKVGKLTKFATPGNGLFLDAFISIYGVAVAEKMIDLQEYNGLGVKIQGIISAPECNKPSRNHITIGVNNRWISNIAIRYAIEEAYHGLLMKGQFPLAVVLLTIDPALVDVNVHPGKREVRFKEESKIYSSVQRSIRPRLLQTSKVVEMPINFDTEYLSKKSITGKSGDKIRQVQPRIEEYDFMKDNESLSFKQRLPQIEIIKQINKKFLLGVGEDGVYLLDQHAVHERIRFEELMKQYSTKRNDTQTLLDPFVLDLGPEEKELIESKIELFNQFGLEIELFGKDTFIVRSVPIFLQNTDLRTSVFDILNMYKDNPQITKSEERLAASMACHSSIRAGMTLSIEEIKVLLENLQNCENPKTCAHGRPTLIAMPYKDIEVKFGRC